MTVRGTVRAFSADEGWGIIDSPGTPGGCWVHFSAIEIEGYRALNPGDDVEFEAEAVEQEGFSYRAVHVWPDGATRSVGDHRAPNTGAYGSSMRIVQDDEG